VNYEKGMVIIDKKEKIRVGHIGYMDKATLKSDFLKLSEKNKKSQYLLIFSKLAANLRSVAST
jgi:hypothetical protein